MLQNVNMYSEIIRCKPLNGFVGVRTLLINVLVVLIDKPGEDRFFYVAVSDCMTVVV
jgi:hypothetical protein